MDDHSPLDSDLLPPLDAENGAGDDDFSIPFDTFFAILDEDPNPDSQCQSQVISEGLANGELAPGYMCPDGFKQEGGPDMSNSSVLVDKLTREQQSFQWNAASCIVSEDVGREKELTVFPEYAEGLNTLHFNHQLLQIKTDCSTALDFSGYTPTNLLSYQKDPIQEYVSHSMSFDGNHISSMDIPFNNQMLPNCNVAVDRTADEDLYFPQNTFDSNKKTDCEQIKGANLFQSNVVRSEVNVEDISIFALRGGAGRTDSSYVYGSDDGTCNAARTALGHDFVYREDSRSTPMVCSTTPYYAKLSKILVSKKTTESKHILCDRKEEIFHKNVEEEEEQLAEKVEEGEDQLAEQNSCSSRKGDLSTGEHSNEMWSPDLQIMDFEVFSRMPPDHNRHDELSFRSESSTDSSPLPSARNLTFENLDKIKKMVLHSSLNQSSKKQKLMVNNEVDVQMPASYHTQHNHNAVSTSAGLKHPPRSSVIIDDDPDLCILDDISGPPHPPPRPHVDVHPVHNYGFHDHYQPGLGGMRHREDDDRLTLRLALQDLSQPTSEASPPEGLLSVPLLRHQKIALSWMVQKETVSHAGRVYCSGGILADDQGLGKTISTIALILTERSPPSKSCSAMIKKENVEALNLDDDGEDDTSDIDDRKKPRTSNPVVINGSSKKENPAMVTKGRPSAGTLVVCPTSVLRQWADELQSKVTPQANLSFLVYHGTNRTKDPTELAKYDVVLTTYSIVSMEVPKQPLGDDDEEKSKHPALGMDSLTDKKRKSSGLNRKGSKDGNALDSALLEATARPLARVNWFRVILDEAQSIKNHRTQVARSCWGLRAKRRWCLSGTPIQNAVDDLYSYFRFLRYGPLATYKSFCSMIKMPISRNPVNGYKKLQAVLKTIMLRRTKGSLIDGKPIITLPPKTIALKKVEFSKEERTFYSSLEAESREQFQAYAAEGTVKQNYVNILLMLLRLRQACDHPHLVKGHNSSSVWKSSLELAKKLPKEKQMALLSHLEARSAICSICNDPPEDAVVTTCGHVFCNQCICEHFTADDSICPYADCKSRLNVSSVFSRGTLISSMSTLTGDDNHSGDSGSDILDPSKSCSSSSHSSKIKAALEILLSLPKSGSSSKCSSQRPGDETCSPIESPSAIFSERYSLNSHEREKPFISKSSCGVTEKAIVFSQWTRMLDLLEVPLKESGIQYRRLDGTMSIVARDKAVKDFNTVPEVTVMIMSLKAASLGLNMVAACHVVLLDLWWNPTTEDQAIDRAHRIGQRRPVTVSRLTVKDTVEDRILALQEKKREMVASAFGEDESVSRQTRLTVDDLRYLFMA